MAVTWLWKAKRGEVIYYDEVHKKSWKLQMFGGNMLSAFIYRYRILNEETNKLEGYYNFFIYIDDINHAKRMLKKDANTFRDLPLGKHTLRKFRLCITSNNSYANEEMLQLAKLLVKYGYKVELY